MRNSFTTLLVVFFICLSSPAFGEGEKNRQLIIDHPELYLSIKDWNYFIAARVFLINNVTIENRSDIAYKDIKVKIYYFSTTGSTVGQIVSSTAGVLPITVPPNSLNTYLRNPYPLGAGSYQYKAGNIKILSAKPITTKMGPKDPNS